MIWLLRDFDLLSILLHAAAFSAEAVALGGILFLLTCPYDTRQSSLRLLRWSAFGLGLATAAGLAISMLELTASAGFPLSSLWSTGFVREALAECIAALSLGLLACVPGMRRVFLLMPAAVVLVAAVAQSHAASRLSDRAVLLVFTLLHHIAVAGWVGAMPYLLLALRGGEDGVRMARGYARLAVVCAPMLVLTGIGMSWYYVGSWQGLYGTTYGLMIAAKTYLVLLMLGLGASSHLLVRGPTQRAAAAGMQRRLRRFSEVEIALGFTAILAAASLTAQSPALDTPQDQASIHQIVERMQWQWPRMHSPRFGQLTPPTPIQVSVANAAYADGSSSDAEDRAWSEYNHHWAGLIVLACGLLALAGRARLPRWARHTAAQWPLLFVGLSVFILLRADPENWPLGPRPFWASFSAPDVLEHRFFALLIAAFAVFEWAVETGRWRSRRAAYVFPLLLACGGAALLTHSHTDGDPVQETLIAISHTAIAMLGVTAGAARWLQLRLPGSRAARAAAWLWPVCLILVGLVLLDYREG